MTMYVWRFFRNETPSINHPLKRKGGHRGQNKVSYKHTYIHTQISSSIYVNRIHRVSLNPEQPFISQQFFNSSFGLSGYRPLHLVSVIFGYSEIKSCRSYQCADQLCFYAFFLHCAHLWLLAVQLRMQTDRFRSFKIQFRRSPQFRISLHFCPLLLTRNFSQKAGRIQSEASYKRRAPLSELNIYTVHPEKRKVGRPKKAKCTDETSHSITVKRQR